MAGLTTAEGFIALLALKGVGPKIALRVAARFSSFEEAAAAGPAEFKGVANETVARKLRDPGAVAEALASARRLLAEAGTLEAGVLTVHDGRYPSRLATCEDAPMVLTHFGDLAVAERSLAVFGSRQPCETGAEVTRRMCSVFAGAGLSLVAGIDRGVARIAHEACASAGIPSVAVLPSGIDWYRSDDGLEAAQRVHDGGGTIVSEQPFGTQGDFATAIRCLRLQSGMASALLVTQADIRPETTNAIRYALREGREIFAPLLPARAAEADESRATVALTSLTGRQLADAFDVGEDFRGLLEERYRDIPVATPIRGRDDYEAVLARIEASLSPAPGPEPEPVASPTP